MLLAGARNRWGILYFSIMCIFALGHPAYADEHNKPGVISKKKYIHVCPQGTERVGEGPPGSSIVFCKQELYNGSRLEGEYAKFYRNGNKQFQGSFEKGKKHGTWISYYRTGEVREVKKYMDGEVIKVTQYKRDGKELEKRDSDKANNAIESKVYSELRETKRGGAKKRNLPISMGWPRK
jgi:hypothetical protein